MLKVAREDFVPVAQREAAYLGENLNLGGGRVLLEPRTLAKMLDVLAISNNDLVLDIGCAYGYSTAVIAHIAEAVVAVEEDEQWAKEAQETLMTSGADNAIVQAGPLVEGAAKHGPYDVILIQGGIETVPDAILNQLKVGGRIACIFMSGALGEVRIGYKDEHGVSWRVDFNAGAPVLKGFAREKAFQF
jgi:protein-L-isoaspartate(D-aspartate) O-methyltransferase